MQYFIEGILDKDKDPRRENLRGLVRNREGSEMTVAKFAVPN